MKIGEKIKQLRKARGMSLNKLGQELGISRQAVFQWQKGGEPSKQHIDKLAKFFDLPYEFFRGDSEVEQPDTLESKTRRLSTAERKIIEAAVDAFLAQHPTVKKNVK